MRHFRPTMAAVITGVLGTASGILWCADPANAQQAWQDLAIAHPGGQPTPPVRPKFRTLADDASETPSIAPALSGDATQPGDLARDGAGRGVAPQRAQADGETEPPVSADLPVDEHIIVAENVVPEDGTEPYEGDPRLPADRDAFLSPPSGYDSLAFQIELDPATDAHPARLARFEPFAPVGHRAGGWVIFPTLEAGVSATSNVYHSSDAKSDLIFDVRPTLLMVSDWQRHAMQFKMTALGSAYDRFASEDDRSYAFESRGRLDITRLANIEVLSSHSVDQETRFSTFTPTDAARRTPYSTDRVAVAYNQRLNQLSVQVRGTLTGTAFQPVPAYDGSLIDNTARDLVARDVAVRTAWNFSPALAAFAETAFNSQTYFAVPADGIGRDSTGDRLRAGLSFGSASQIWRGEIAAGYGRQHAADGRLQDAAGLLFDANLAWRPTQITSLLFNAQTDFVTSTLPGEGNATQRLTSIELRHAFQRRLNGTAILSYQETDYQGLSLVERQTSGSLGLEYYLARSATLLGSYQHAITTSTAPGANATVDTVRLGVRYQP